MQSDRRAFVKATGGMAAVLGTVGMAGCGGLTGGGGGSGGEGWQYDPGTISSAETKFFGSLDVAQMYANRDVFPESTRQNIESNEQSPVDPANVDAVTGVGGVEMGMGGQSTVGFGSAAITGSFDTGAVTSEVAASGDVEQTGEYEGYTLYRTSSLPQAPGNTPEVQGSGSYAVGENAVLFGMSVAQDSEASVTGDEAVRASIDASAGNATLLRDNSQYATQLSNAIGDATMRFGVEIDPVFVDLAQEEAGPRQSQFVTGLRAGGLGATIGGQTTTYTGVLIYENAQRAEESGVVPIVDGMGAQLENQDAVNTVNASRNGATVVATIEGDTQAILQQGQNTTGQTFDVAPRQL